jgi:hypothetical protein
MNRGLSLDIINNEILKCEVRCANCHTRKTAEQFGWFKCNLVCEITNDVVPIHGEFFAMDGGGVV